MYTEEINLITESFIILSFFLKFTVNQTQQILIQ